METVILMLNNNSCCSVVMWTDIELNIESDVTDWDSTNNSRIACVCVIIVVFLRLKNERIV